ncbi:hypothetical protein AB0I54_46455 [Streptomyces sp. NPDC050625]|uniref:hypothetical protein n=1 Tax=Streptomyces sp. NPDC050625 TaxID=3154629 RepID=UPI003432F1FE
MFDTGSYRAAGSFSAYGYCHLPIPCPTVTPCSRDVDLTGDGAHDSMRQRAAAAHPLNTRHAHPRAARAKPGRTEGRCMTSERTGWFVSIDGPNGVGKSTSMQALHDLLADQGHPATQTVHHGPGYVHRAHAGEIHGMALASVVLLPRSTSAVPARIELRLVVRPARGTSFTLSREGETACSAGW